MKKLLAIIIFCSCGPTDKLVQRGAPFCVSVCGSKLMTDLWSCDEYQQAENISLTAYNKYVKDNRFASACKKMSGVQTVAHEERAWIDQWGRKVAGLTYCQAQTIEIGGAPLFKHGPGQAYGGAFTHEMAHIIQNCTPLPPCDPNSKCGCDHANWDRDGITDADVYASGN